MANKKRTPTQIIRRRRMKAVRDHPTIFEEETQRWRKMEYQHWGIGVQIIFTNSKKLYQNKL
jgi:hypothetical protein